MENKESKCYDIKMFDGRLKRVKKKQWIEDGDPKNVTIEQMSDIGKLTHLFWGYNIVDKDGKIFRKFKFLTKYPDEAKMILDNVYPKFHKYNKEQEIAYRQNYLNEVVLSTTGFTVIRTSELR